MTHRRRLTALATIVTAALAAALGINAPAHAATVSSSYTTYNRPSETEAGGGEYIAWADKTSAGNVNIALLNPTNGSTVTHWIYTGSSTAPATGPTITSVSGQAVVVAWADGNGDINLAYLESGGLACISNMRYWLSPTTVTPYITTEGDDGTGNLLLAWADTSLHMHISIVNTPIVLHCGTTNGFSVVGGNTTDVGSDTTWDGPSLTTSGYGTGSEHLWLSWASTDSAHHINIAKYTPASVYGTFNQVSKITESTHGTSTDMGGAYFTDTGDVWISYCGTNNSVYYQLWAASNSTGGGTEMGISSGSCDVYTFNGYVSGGVGVGYDYSTSTMVFTWADKSSYTIQRYLV